MEGRPLIKRYQKGGKVQIPAFLSHDTVRYSTFNDLVRFIAFDIKIKIS
jgi:hypothetical protein